MTNSKLMLAGVLLGTAALVGACTQPETRTTTTEQTTTHQVAPVMVPATSVTTTKTQVYTP